MKKPFFDKENGIEWYVNLNPVEKYLQIDRNDHQIASKFVSTDSEKRFPRKMIKRISKHRIESLSAYYPATKKA